jgi:hypothetical protein
MRVSTYLPKLRGRVEEFTDLLIAGLQQAKEAELAALKAEHQKLLESPAQRKIIPLEKKTVDVWDSEARTSRKVVAITLTKAQLANAIADKREAQAAGSSTQAIRARE